MTGLVEIAVPTDYEAARKLLDSMTAAPNLRIAGIRGDGRLLFEPTSGCPLHGSQPSSDR